MFLLFDCLPFQSVHSRARGIARYSANLLEGLIAARPDWRIELLVHDYLPPPEEGLNARHRTLIYKPPLPIVSEFHDANEAYFGDWLSALRPDWILHPSLFEDVGLIPQYSDYRPRIAAVIHDLIPLQFCNTYGIVDPKSKWYARRFRKCFQTDLLLANSESTASDARRLLGPNSPRVVNVRGAADPFFSAAPSDEFLSAEQRVRKKFRITKQFILYVGSMDLRKNMVGAISGYAELPESLKEQYDLVLACSLDEASRAILSAEAAKRGVADRVQMTGFVSDEELRTFYQACRLFFFPSHYEGLGLPVVEAMCHGAPVVASANSSLPEYAGPLSWYCDPESPSAMSSALQTALQEPYAQRLAERIAFARGFTWIDTGDRAAQAIETQRFCVPAVPRTKRIAWVSPAPPADSGIADYASEVAASLGSRFEIEWIVDPVAPASDTDLEWRIDSVGSMPDAAVSRRYAVIRGDEVDTRHAANPYDLFVYHVGNNYFQMYMLAMMAKYPGLTVIHDMNLGGLARLSIMAGAWPAALEAELAYNGEYLYAEWMKEGRLDPVSATTLCTFNRRVIEASPSIVVHSRHAWHHARKITDAPVAIVPLIAVAPSVGTREDERTRLKLPADHFIVSTLGNVGYSKRIDVIIDAVANLPPDIRRKTLVLVVGPIHHTLAERYRDQAAELGLSDQVLMLGRVPLEDFTAYARASDVVVQLRYPSNGETSGALTRAMAAGAACITSDMATMAEIPNEVTIKVRSPLRDRIDLTAALTRLARDPEYKNRMGENARRYLAETHGPAVVAAKYAAAIDQTIALLDARDAPWMNRVLNALADATGEVPPGLFDQWALLRDRARQPAPADVPGLPEVPLPSQPKRQVA